MNSPKILYFTSEAELSAKEKLELAEIEFPVKIRNSRFAEEFESCDGVLGNVPKSYAHVANGRDVWTAYHNERLARLRSSLPADEDVAKPPQKSASNSGETGGGVNPFGGPANKGVAK